MFNSFDFGQIDDCRDLSSLFYLLPFQRGYLVNWDHQKTIWDYLFGKNCFSIEPSGITGNWSCV
jgi:actin-related protein